MPKPLRWEHSGSLSEATSPLSMAHGPVCSGLDSCHVHTHLPNLLWARTPPLPPSNNHAHSLGPCTRKHYCQLWQEPAPLSIWAGTLYGPKDSRAGTGSLCLACTFSACPCALGRTPPPSHPTPKCAGTGPSQSLLPEHTPSLPLSRSPNVPARPPFASQPIPIGLRDLPGRNRFREILGPTLVAFTKDTDMLVGCLAEGSESHGGDLGTFAGGMKDSALPLSYALRRGMAARGRSWEGTRGWDGDAAGAPSAGGSA